MTSRRHPRKSPSTARIALSAALGGLVAAVGLPALGQGGASAPAERSVGRLDARYSVECTEGTPPVCASDLTTYIGWRVFDRYCAACHGADAAGSTFAPSLMLRLRRFDRRAFERALDQGYTGPSAPLPPWGEHPQVARYYSELWAYLAARANGDAPPGPLRPLRERDSASPQP